MTKVKEKQPTYYESIINNGFSRRDFMKFSAFMAAYLGYETSAIGQIEKALKETPRLPIIWEHFQECTCCSESFIRSDHPIVADIILDKVSLDYTLSLMAASGHQAEAAKHETMKKYHGEYILAVEGSVPAGEDGVYCVVAGKTAKQHLEEAAAGAKAIIAWGSCASSGCVQAASPNPTEAKPIHKIITDKPIVRVPGCPPIGEVMAGVIMHVITFGRLPELDGQGRPKAFYNKRVHDSCYRRPYFDAGLFVEDFDDENAKKGYCLYKVGCKGPTTYNACGSLGWNGGVSYPIKSGHGCFGCSEDKFWDYAPIYEREQTTAGFGIESNADTVGKVVAGVTVGAALVHGVSASLARNKKVSEEIKEGKSVEKKIEEKEK